MKGGIAILNVQVIEARIPRIKMCKNIVIDEAAASLENRNENA